MHGPSFQKAIPSQPRGSAPVVIRLRAVVPADVPVIYELQRDPEANRMAGTKPRTREVFFANWERIFADPRVNARVIEVVGEEGIAGLISVFQAEERDNVGYWVARAHWGRGIASAAAVMFLADEKRRPLRATAASDNAASLRILEKCGFRRVRVFMGEETERYVAREVAEFELG